LLLEKEIKRRLGYAMPATGRSDRITTGGDKIVERINDFTTPNTCMEDDRYLFFRAPYQTSG